MVELVEARVCRGGPGTICDERQQPAFDLVDGDGEDELVRVQGQEVGLDVIPQARRNSLRKLDIIELAFAVLSRHVEALAITDVGVDVDDQQIVEGKGLAVTTLAQPFQDELPAGVRARWRLWRLDRVEVELEARVRDDAADDRLEHRLVRASLRHDADVHDLPAVQKFFGRPPM